MSWSSDHHHWTIKLLSGMILLFVRCFNLLKVRKNVHLSVSKLWLEHVVQLVVVAPVVSGGLHNPLHVPYMY